MNESRVFANFSGDQDSSHFNPNILGMPYYLFIIARFHFR